MKTLCLINQKGGCGKSSTCFHLAGGLIQAGLRVLLVDADPQGSLGQAFFGSQRVERMPTAATLASLWDSEMAGVGGSALPQATAWQGLSIICANHTLAAHNHPLPEESGWAQFMLAEFLESVSEYDVALVDCPPNLYQCSWNALLAADEVIIPVPPEDFGAQGLRAVHQAVEHARQLNGRLRLLGHLVTRYDRRLLVHRSYENRLRQLYGPAVLSTVIPEVSAFKVALTCRKPVTFHAPRSRAALQIGQLTQEILDRIGLGSMHDMTSRDSAVIDGQYT